MKRVMVLVGLLTIGSLSLVVARYREPQAGGQQQTPRVVEVEKLKDNLFVLKGGGGNTAVFVTANGVVVVDTKNPGWGQPILDKIKELTSKPVTTIIRVLRAYCACPNEETSVQAGQVLLAAGFKRVRVLKGGCQAWLQAKGQLEPKS